MSIRPPRLSSEPLLACCIARLTALVVRDLLLLLEEVVSMEDLGLLFLRARPFWTIEWVECDGTAAGRALPSCRGRCHQIERCWDIEAECTALHHLGLEVHGLEVELVVLVVGAEDLSACGLCHHHDSCRTDREAEEGTGEPYVEAEED